MRNLGLCSNEGRQLFQLVLRDRKTRIQPFIIPWFADSGRYHDSHIGFERNRVEGVQALLLDRDSAWGRGGAEFRHQNFLGCLVDLGVCALLNFHRWRNVDSPDFRDGDPLPPFR